MKTLKKHIAIAIITCLFSIIFYTLFQFTPDDNLRGFRNRIVSILGLSSNISVDTFKSYITTLSSGIFISTVVALLFYLNEYRVKKENALKKLLCINHALCKKYSELTYIAYSPDTELGKLAINYYLEHYDNKFIEYIQNVGMDFIKKQDKSVKRKLKREIENNSAFKFHSENRENLIRYLSEHPEELQVGHNDNRHSISVDTKLSDIILELDYKLDMFMEKFQELMKINLDELYEVVLEVSQFFKLTKKETKLIKVKYNDLGKALDLLDFNNSANKIYSIHENAINKIKTAYSHFDISECTEFNKKSIIEFVFFLYSTFISVTDDELTNSKYEYNHFLYIQNGLSKIIGFKLYNTLVPIDKRKYIFPRNEFEEGYRSHVIITNMKDLYLDIYK